MIEYFQGGGGATSRIPIVIAGKDWERLPDSDKLNEVEVLGAFGGLANLVYFFRHWFVVSPISPKIKNIYLLFPNITFSINI